MFITTTTEVILEESVCNAENPGLIPGSGRSTGEKIERKSQEHLLY